MTTVKSSVTHAYTYGDERRVQVMTDPGRENDKGVPANSGGKTLLMFAIHLFFPAVSRCVIDSAARAEDAQGTLTQNHTSPSILIYEVEKSASGGG